MTHQFWWFNPYLHLLSRLKAFICPQYAFRVGGFKYLDYFPFHISENPSPIDELHHFSRWLKPPSSFICPQLWPMFPWRNMADFFCEGAVEFGCSDAGLGLSDQRAFFTGPVWFNEQKCWVHQQKWWFIQRNGGFRWWVKQQKGWLNHWLNDVFFSFFHHDFSWRHDRQPWPLLSRWDMAHFNGTCTRNGNMCYFVVRFQK